MTVHPQISISPSQLLARTHNRSSIPPLVDQILLQVLWGTTGALLGTPVAPVDSVVWLLSCGRGGIIPSPSSARDE